MLVRSCGNTDVGCQRKDNEDTVVIDEELSLFIVADGMGGHQGGEVASRMATQSIGRELAARLDKIRTALKAGSVEERDAARKEVSQSIVVACKEVHSHAMANEALRGMGTTVALLLVIESEAIVAHVGDSRVYMLRDGNCTQLTEDHTMLQEHLRFGLITPEEAKTATYGNVISRSVGVHPTVKADTLSVELMPGDEFILCSDGLHGYLAEGELTNLVAGLDMQGVVSKLIDLAKERGGRDNISVIDVRAEVPKVVSSSPARPAAAPGNAADKMVALRNIPLFRFLEYKELVRVLSIVSLRTFDPGKDVVVEGEVGNEMFVVLSGSVEVRKAGNVLVRLQRMKHFGEMALVDNQPRSASVTAVEPSKLMVIRREDFLSLVRREPAIGVKLLWSFAQVLSQRLRETSAQVPGKDQTGV